MDASYIAAFVESTRTVFTTMLNLAVTCNAPMRESAIPTDHADISGIIGLSGDVQGTVILSFPRQTALRMVERFVGSALAEESEDFADAIGELVNMVSGGAKGRFVGRDVSISCPTVVVGSGHKVQQMSDAFCIRIPCGSELGNFSVEVCMKDAAARKAKSSAASATVG